MSFVYLHTITYIIIYVFETFRQKHVPRSFMDLKSDT